MPGLHFFFSRNFQNPDHTIQKLQLCKQVIHFADYSSHTLFQDDNCLLCSTRYSAYPVETFRTDRFSFYLEGYIYGNSHSSALNALAMILCRNVQESSAQDNEIRAWLLTVDGDFVLFIRDNDTGFWYCLNDALSRLPIYYVDGREEICVTREIKIAIESTRRKTLSQQALAQYLLFGFTLGSTTMFEGVDRLRGSTVIRFGDNGSITTKTTLTTFAFDQIEGSTVEKEDGLVELFVQACKARAAVGKQAVIGLSGGHDSRVVAAALHRAHVPALAYTWIGEEASDSMETACARIVAKKLEFPLETMRGSSIEKADMAWVVRLKLGLVPTSTGFAFPFFNTILETSSRASVYFSGDGGDKVLPAIAPLRKFHSTDQVVSFIIERESICDIEIVAQICGLDRTTIESNIGYTLSTYPETNLSEKVAHFRIYERGFNWLFEGEDRNRSLLWVCTPFYSLPFFRAAMEISQRKKQYHRFYRRFLTRMNRDMAEIPDANRGLPIASHKYWLRFAAIGLLERNPRLLSFFKRRLKSGAFVTTNKASYLVDMLEEQITKRHASVIAHMDIDYLQSVLKKNPPLSETALHNLLTLVMATGEMNQ